MKCGGRTFRASLEVSGYYRLIAAVEATSLAGGFDYFALAKRKTVLKIKAAPINSIREKDTCRNMADRIIEQSGSPTVKMLACVGGR